MKKLSISLLVMLLIASLFTSCSNGSDDASDVRVKVRLTPSSGSRSLSTDIEKINLNDDSITWHYSATKVSEKQFNYGATSDSLLPKDGIVTLSQGDWTIKLWAYKDSKKVYDSDESKVTIKWNFYEPNVTVTVPVKQNTGDNGFIVINNVTIPNGNSNVAPNYISIDETEIIKFQEPYLRLECAPGSHKITFEYRSDSAVISSKSLFVTVLSGRETTISGKIEESEITSGGSSAPTSEVQVIEVKKEAEVKVETSVAPATTSTPGTKTTVTFPAGSFNDNSSNAVLNLSVKSAGSEFSVSATGQSKAVAGISISLVVNDKEVTTFNDKEVEIETYIATGLTGVKVYYDGQPLNSNDYSYDKDSGKLTIRTKHFSEFYVGTDSVAVNVTTNKGYKTLEDALNEVSDNKPTIVLLNDVNFSSVIEIGKSLTIDGNGHNIFNTANRVIRITQPNLDVNLYNLGVISKCTAESDVRGISFDKISSNSSLLLDGCTVSASFYAINIIPGANNLNITIKNGTVAAGWAAINSYSNKSTFTIKNSTLRGLNDKGESSWNDFATIVFDSNGLGDSHNIGNYGSNNTLKITDSTVYASSESSNKQAWLAIQYGAQNNEIILDSETKIIDKKGIDQSDLITIIPFVGWVSAQEKYTKSYDLHSTLIVGDEKTMICYHGEIDHDALITTGAHVPYQGCDDIEWSNVKTITPDNASSITWTSDDTLYYLAPGEYGNFSAYLHAKENVGFYALPGAKFTKVEIGYHAGQDTDLAQKQNSTLTVKGFNVDGHLFIHAADQKVVVEDNTAAQITIKTSVIDNMNIQVLNNTLTGGSNTTKAPQNYGVYIVPNTTKYDLNISGNTFRNIHDHAIAVQGNGDGSAVTAANSIIVENNKFESYGLNRKDGRAAFKIWADTKYAPTANGGEINSDASSLIKNIHDNNTFSSSLGTNCVLGNFYGKLVQFNNQGTN